MKRCACLLLVLAFSLALTSAWADGAPASQFGFRGWPYRQQTNCSSCSLACGACKSDQDCAQCDSCAPCLATARPQETEQPPLPTAAPTAQPAQTPTKRPAAQPTARPTATSAASTGDYTTISVTVQEQKLLNLLNQDRAANGLPALALDAELSTLARLKSCDMKEKGYFSHTSPTYGNAAAMLTAFGYAYQGVGENIAHHANVEKAEAAFMSSPGHKGNILGSQWSRVGIGICVDSNGFLYITQLFVR